LKRKTCGINKQIPVLPLLISIRQTNKKNRRIPIILPWQLIYKRIPENVMPTPVVIALMLL
jgi:hypothetical protein